MGDRCYARLSIPLTAVLALAAETFDNMAHALDEDTDELHRIVSANKMGERSGNGCIISDEDGVPCLVSEWEEVAAAAGFARDGLQTLGIPYVCAHSAGKSYGPGWMAFTGEGEEECAAGDIDDGVIMIGAIENPDGTLTANPKDVATAQAYVAARRKVFNPLVPA